MTDDHDASGKRGFRPRVEFGAKRPGARSFVLSPEGAFVQQVGKLETLADAVDLFWGVVSVDPSGWSRLRKGYDWLIGNAGIASREDLRRALNWLELALSRRDRAAAVAAARYLALMPAPLLASDYSRLATIFNSRIVGMAWHLTPDFDVKPLPPAVPRFGMEAGFGLIRSVPELYEKLALFGPELEAVVEGLVEEALRYGLSLPDSLTALAPPPSATG